MVSRHDTLRQDDDDGWDEEEADRAPAKRSIRRGKGRGSTVQFTNELEPEPEPEPEPPPLPFFAAPEAESDAAAVPLQKQKSWFFRRPSMVSPHAQMRAHLSRRSAEPFVRRLSR